MNINESKASTVLAAKTARPCDSCLIKRARWFCAADDAFLCQSCDAAVHSANQLASRHQRLRLETSSCKLMAPAWHQGFTKKARTPRQPKARQPDTHQLPLVPEMGSEDATFPEENDEDQLLFCRVPVFEPYEGSMVFDGDLNLDELLSGCDEELAEFAADVEGLIGTGVEEVLMDEKRVKGEEKEDIDDDEEEEEEEVGAMIACHLDPALDMELSWEFNNSELGEKSMKKNDEKGMNNDESSSSQEKKRMLLRLNYEAVIAAWAAQGSPWADGIRPQLKQLEDEFMMMGAWLERDGIKGGRGDAGREARVSRYREKRRTRLFSKKIRYEVRKLNAEKRPRMKGRFVKRTTFLPSSNSSPNYHLIK